MTSQAAQLKYEPGQTIIEIEGLSFSYEPDQPEAPNALGVDLQKRNTFGFSAQRFSLPGAG